MPLSLSREGITSLVKTIPFVDGEIFDDPPPPRALVPVEFVEGIFTIVPISYQFEFTAPDPPQPEQPPWYRGNRVEISPDDISPYEPDFLARLVSLVVLGLFLPAPRTIIRTK